MRCVRTAPGASPARSWNPTSEPAPDLTRKLIDVAVENGLLIGSVGVFGNVIRVAPPLVITQTEAHASLDVFERSLALL